MQPSSPSKMPKSKSRKRIHRGDVSSPAASSDDETDETQITPKRKVINPVEAPLPPSTGKKAKKMTLQERLAAAASAKSQAAVSNAKVKSSRSLAEMSISASESGTSMMTDSASTMLSPPTRSEILPRTATSTTSDKVVVCVRIKPTQSPFAEIAYDMTPTSLSLSDEHPKVKQRGGKAGREDGYTYTFDKLLRHPATTPELYADKVAPLVDKAMNGFNSTIFAYGQTGSGKSFTMTGVPNELGVIPCAVDGVFDAITADTDRAFLLRVSYIEIYNETLRDLLNFKKGPLKDDEKPAIHYSKGKVYVDPLVEEIVSTPQDVMDLLERGNAGRRIGATDWNERSSRSHCVFTIVVESRPRDGDADEDIRLSRLNLIDLAGSEKAVSDSERRGEGKHINQSLLALREVINKLTEKGKATHIPYRNSKLTHLLENALGGDSNICVICTMSAEEEHCSETLETLKFAGRCSQVKTNAKKNILPSSERALIKAKDQEIEDLKRRLQGLTNGQTSQIAVPEAEQISELAESVVAMEARKAKLSAQLAKLNGEILTSEMPRSGLGLPMSPPKPKRRRISDFSAMVASGSGRMGIGLGTPKKSSDRRAVSGMSRVPEEGEEMAGIMGTLGQAAEGSLAKSFDQDRVLAAARRNLAIKEEELVLANRNLASALARASQLSDRDAKITSLEAELRSSREAMTSLEQRVEHAESELRDQTSQLESTRTDLLATIEDRATKIDELENKVLELRKSREELVIDGQVRVDEAAKRADDAEKEREELRGKLSDSSDKNRTNDEVIQRLREEVVTAQTTHAEAQAALQASSKQAEAEYERSITALREQIEGMTTAFNAQRDEHMKLQDDRLSIERQRDEARSDLDRFQRAVMSNETKVLAELREELGNLRRSKEEDKVAWEREKTELESEMQREKARADENMAKVNDVQQIMALAEERENRLKDQLQEAFATLGEAAKANARLEDQLRTERRAKENHVKEKEAAESRVSESLKTLEEAAKVNGRLEAQLREESNAKKVVERERDEARQRLAEADGAGKQLEAEMASRVALEAKVVKVERQLQERTIASESFHKQLEIARTEVEVLAHQLQERTSASEASVKDLETARATIGDLERQLQEGTSTSIEQLDAALAKISELEDKLASTLKDLEVQGSRLESESAARHDADKQLQESILTRDQAVNDLQAKAEKLEEGKKLRLAAEARVDQLLDYEKHSRQSAETQSIEIVKQRDMIERLGRQLKAEVESREAAEKRLAEARKQHETVASEQTEVKTMLDAEVVKRLSLEARLAELVREKDDFTAVVLATKRSLEDAISGRKAAEDQNARLTSEAQAHTATLREEISARQTANEARLAAERHINDVTRELLAKHESPQRVLEEESIALRTALDNLKSALTEARGEADSQKEKAAALSTELFDLRSKPEVTITTSNSSRLRQSAPGPGQAGSDKEMSTTVLDGMKKRVRRGHSTGAGSVGTLDRDNSLAMLRHREDDEIERLEKVIEAQKDIIDQQREKIERWAKEMDKQREIVRLLTNESARPASPVPQTNSPRGHTKSHSISHSPALGTPLHLPAKGIVSSFTARNLALPTSPSPLPMHPSQYNNAAARRARRVTIEHDMDRLSESSKVNKAKAIFESPEKHPPSTPPRAPLGAAQAVRSVPRQRRP
ncbi:hypothetical protein I316_05320 [Kwoniella heveanensis BCC8398]|uniref:Kinesin motor domain-containing protein n=1 Tax=Kwoniella heveanensis BCC8398 TaxID=1296120 RepID=A0A1B9GPJ9_9TREE|nr:hypothetical protein I316_05320 [Kwoniella heveanensis BCC8398]